VSASRGAAPSPALELTRADLFHSYFRFAGQVVAKALWDEQVDRCLRILHLVCGLTRRCLLMQLLDAHFTLSLYKHILNQVHCTFSCYAINCTIDALFLLFSPLK
jgi:hypothetical protein